MRLSAYETYVMYLAIKMHFTQKNYDYIKYRGKVSASPDTFATRRDKYMFQKLSRQHNADEMLGFLVANFIKENVWVGDLLTNEASEIYSEYKYRTQSFTYLFTNEIDNLFSNYEPTIAFKAKRNSLSPFIEYKLSSKISPETFCVLCKTVGLVPYYDKVIGEDDFIWAKLRMLSLKYTPFIEYDASKIKSILKEKIDVYGKEQEKSIASASPREEVQTC